MKTIKTDSLGLEILSSVSQQENSKKIKTFKTKEEALNNQIEENITLFELYKDEKIEEYFILETDIYNKWTIEYKIEGVEL